MKHFYFEIDGWFGFERIYQDAVRELDGVFVEVGAWKGRSTAFLAVEAINSGKAIDLHVVDTFRGSDEAAHRDDPDIKYLRSVFDENMRPIAGFLTVHETDSLSAAEFFEDGSVSFVLLDAAHDFDSVKADIKAWLPKVKPGGILAGDDIHWGGDRPVFRAVCEMLSDWEKVGSGWVYRKGDA